MSVTKTACVAVLLLVPVALAAQKADTNQITPEEFMAKLSPRSGTVVISNGLATLQVPPTFRYIDAAAAKRLLTEAWGNPPAASEGVLGMLYPADVSPLDSGSWGVIISFDEDGYVNDSGAAAIDYTKLMQQMQQGVAESNEERRKDGYATVQLVGWAEQPHYNPETHKLYWAKELAFSDNTHHTLNYNVRVLGRRGVLVLNAVSSMNALPEIAQSMQNVIGFVDFNAGHRYQDFIPGADKKAAYGVAGLIVGAVAAKAGFFKLLWVGILAFKKLIVAAVAAVGVWMRRVFGKKQSPQAPAAPPTAA
ncbi:MAG TPA: DUF2167 domain-containing protein [Gemmatimonadales bacterium]|nr:DUF2167 domain-containing protein [Gemmatimonadales bacterium]